MAVYEQVNIQLYEAAPGGEAGPIITASGGFITVCKAADPTKATLTVPITHATQANGFALTAGGANFEIDTSVETTGVDVFIMCPGGQFVTKATCKPGENQICVDVRSRGWTAVIPFSLSDSVAATEKDTGYDVPANSMLFGRLSGCGLRVTTLEAAKTVDVGILSSESGGSANGLIAASSLAATGLVIGTNGSLFSTNAPHKSDAVTGKSISYTLSAGTTVAEGYIIMPYILCGA